VLAAAVGNEAKPPEANGRGLLAPGSRQAARGLAPACGVVCALVLNTAAATSVAQQAAGVEPPQDAVRGQSEAAPSPSPNPSPSPSPSGAPSPGATSSRALPPPPAASVTPPTLRSVPVQRAPGNTPVYAALRDAELRLQAVQEKLEAFEFHGYLRTGYGLNSRGGQQVAFQAPGAPAKYRLGNEAETYGEFVFISNLLNLTQDLDRPWFRTEIMLQAATTNAASFSPNDSFHLQEAFLQVGNLWSKLPGARIWAGERYYRRQDIHINDFYTVDMTGYGAGIEDLDLGLGRLAVAVIGGTNEDVATQRGAYSKFNVDVRLYDITVPLGHLALWVNGAGARGGIQADGTNVETAGGWAVGVKHLSSELLGGFNNLLVAYGRGVATSFRSTLALPTPFMEDAVRLLITDHMLLAPAPFFAIMPAVIYQRQKSGDPAGGTDEWFSAGARPIFFLSDYASVAIEGGMDWVSDGQGRYEGWLRKLSLAPQFSPGREFFSRPVARMFVTYADWSPALRGYVGGAPYAERLNGMTYGIQAESWW
jgi:maltoporin